MVSHHIQLCHELHEMEEREKKSCYSRDDDNHGQVQKITRSENISRNVKSYDSCKKKDREMRNKSFHERVRAMIGKHRHSECGRCTDSSSHQELSS